MKITKNKETPLLQGFILGTVVSCSFLWFLSEPSKQEISTVPTHQIINQTKKIECPANILQKASPKINNITEAHSLAKVKAPDDFKEKQVLKVDPTAIIDWEDFISNWEINDDVTLSASKNLHSLSQYLLSNPSQLEEAIAVILNEPLSQRRSVLIEAAKRLPDPQVLSVGEALIISELPANRIDGLTLIGSRDLDILPQAIETVLKNETDSQVVQTALKWATNVTDSNTFESIRASVENLALSDTDPLVKQEALATMLYLSNDDSIVLSEIEYMLTSSNQEERNAALYSMSTSQSAANGESVFWKDIQNTLNDIVKDEGATIESRLQALHVLRDLATPNES